MTITEAKHQTAWDDFLRRQRFSPFLQSWTMGEVYRDIGQVPVRLQAEENGVIVGICQGIIVSARRGKHIAVPYGPVVSNSNAIGPLLDELRHIARTEKCHFLRLSPFWPQQSYEADRLIKESGSRDAPLHLLGEHIWYLPLTDPDTWKSGTANDKRVSSDDLMASMRSTTRNLIRRAGKEGVTVSASNNPASDLEHFLKLHELTRKRHGFTPYTDTFFRAQLQRFSERGECSLYIARHQGEVLATSIHMRFGGETSYHHGASLESKIPASYLLQWTAINDAIKRDDHTYSFWGIAPVELNEEGKWRITHHGKNHPFAGVTLFKTGFGGSLLNLMHCRDIPLSPTYNLTRAIELMRKWKRGF
ncbi:MAG TPA: peptidoglycan bridge formation glycyltransferase FemA/FemB family protein [Candidatus Peribacteraceae bacterium]|nr:peptidoglycan bridge formation glycyltransferase FemA/FemB family protein [Candidatus Peribacteraceae bacterium]